MNVFIHTGFTPIKNRTENITPAKRKFIITQARRTADFAKIFFS
jgi:hypothetical protein